MKITAQEMDQRQMVLEIEVEDERLARAMEDAYRRVSLRVNVPGFRRGKAPRPLVERMVGREAILENAVESLVPQAYRDALGEQNIEAAGQPDVEVTSVEPLQFKATVPLPPSVVLGDYRSIAIDQPSPSVEAAEIDQVVERLRESNATWAPVERPVQAGDRVAMNIKGVRGDRIVIDATDAEFVVDPAGPQPMVGFAEQLVGLEPGPEREFAIGQQPATEEAVDTAVQEPTQFTVKLHSVKERQLSDADDGFAQSLGEYETIAALRAAIEENILQRKESEGRSRWQEQVILAAVDQSTVVSPPQLEHRQAETILQNMAASLDRQGISIQQYIQITGKSEEEFRAELLEDAQRSLKRDVVLGAIADVEGLAVTDDEIVAEIEAAMSGQRDAAKRARQSLRSEGTRSRVGAIIKSRKAMEWLIDRAGGAAQAEIDVTEKPEEASSGDSNE